MSSAMMHVINKLTTDRRRTQSSFSESADNYMLTISAFLEHLWATVTVQHEAASVSL